MIALIAILATLAAVVTLTDWRRGLLITVTVGFVQDPIRKLTPGEPIYLTVLVGAFFALTVLAAALQQRLPRLARVYEWRAFLRMPILAFAVIVAAQALHTLLRFGSPVLAGIGLLAYLMPLPAMLLAFLFARGRMRVQKLLGYYCAWSLVMAVGVYLSFLGYGWRVLEQVGQGLVISSHGMTLEAHTGFLRSPEVAAWHIGSAACFLVILGALTPRSGVRALLGAAVVFLIGAGLLTGRRKMLVEVVLFMGLYLCLLAYYRRGAWKVATLTLIITLVGSAALIGSVRDDRSQHTLDPYLQRGMTGFDDASQRFSQLGLQSVVWAFRRHGWLGAGAGTGSQGAQYFGGGAALVGGAAEGGLGKVVTELGLPGLLALFWLGVAVLRYVRRTMAILKRETSALSLLTYGLLSFALANAATFIAASQVYGDFFVLLIVGWSMGFILAAPQVLKQDARAFRARQQRSAGAASVPFARRATVAGPTV